MSRYNFEENTLPNNRMNNSEPEYSFSSPYKINLDRPKPNYNKRNRSLRLQESVRSK